MQKQVEMRPFSEGRIQLSINLQKVFNIEGETVNPCLLRFKIDLPPGVQADVKGRLFHLGQSRFSKGKIQTGKADLLFRRIIPEGRLSLNIPNLCSRHGKSTR